KVLAAARSLAISYALTVENLKSQSGPRSLWLSYFSVGSKEEGKLAMVTMGEKSKSDEIETKRKRMKLGNIIQDLYESYECLFELLTWVL
ncbi:unnamed protein product, partial [Oikopleura dioica]